MRTLDEVRTAIKAHIPEILADLQASCDRQPWCTLPSEDRLNNLAEVATGLVDVALGSNVDRATRLKEVRAAAEHGEHRLNVGLPEDLLFVEFILLRQALWRYLQDHVPLRLAHDASARLDAAGTVATKAALRGYHRKEFEARGEWPQVINQLADRLPIWIHPSVLA